MNPYDLGNDPVIAASILADQLGCDPDGEFVIGEEMWQNNYREVFRGKLVSCIEHLEDFIDVESPMAIIQA